VEYLKDSMDGGFLIFQAYFSSSLNYKDFLNKLDVDPFDGVFESFWIASQAAIAVGPLMGTILKKELEEDNHSLATAVKIVGNVDERYMLKPLFIAHILHRCCIEGQSFKLEYASLLFADACICSNSLPEPRVALKRICSFGILQVSSPESSAILRCRCRS
jgi:hypothetical protein